MKCRDCRFYARLSDVLGQCRAEPPAVIALTLETPTDKGHLSRPYTTWPNVKSDDWCGGWERGISRG